MIADLKPYRAMKDSGVEWLGDVPEHWEVRKLRRVLRAVTERNRPDLPLLSVVREKGVILRDVTNKDENPNFIPDDLTNYKVVRDGQFAMNKMKAWQGSYGISRYDGIVSPAYFIFNVDGVGGDFLHAATRSKAYVPFFTQASDGVRIGQWDLSQARMREIPFSVPPLPEQTAIVRYLDYMDRRIRRYIRAKQKLIGLLEEQKQAIIHRAVTRGLDPDVPLKPSGVEWLGDVPEHWQVRRAKYLLREVDQRSADGTEMLLRVSQYTGVTPRSADDTSGMPRAESLVGYKRVGCDEFVINIMLAWNGSLGVSRFEGVVSPAYCVYRFAPGLYPWYFHHLLRDPLYRRRIKAASTGVIESRLRLYSDELGRIEMLVPSLREQVLIAQHIEHETKTIDIAIDRSRREVELLCEYRTRLTADVVTGKLDVREAAANLPDEPEPMDEADDLMDEGDAMVDDLDTAPEEVEL